MNKAENKKYQKAKNIKVKLNNFSMIFFIKMKYT